MDNSEQYKIMCEQAKEIQSLKTWIPPIKIEDMKNYWVAGDIQEFIWLPRQDQLQEIAKSYPLYSHIGLDTIMFLFCDWVASQNYDFINSLEQEWLKFAMEIKYNKIWDCIAQNWELKKEITK